MLDSVFRRCKVVVYAGRAVLAPTHRLPEAHATHQCVCDRFVLPASNLRAAHNSVVYNHGINKLKLITRETGRGCVKVKLKSLTTCHPPPLSDSLAPLPTPIPHPPPVQVTLIYEKQPRSSSTASSILLPSHT